MQRTIQLLLAMAMALSAAGYSAPGALASTPNVESPGFSAATDTLVVGYEPGARVAAQRAIESADASISAHHAALDAMVVEPPANTDIDEVARTLAQQPGVAFAEPEVLARVTGVPNDEYFPMQWGLSRIGVPAAHDLSVGSAAVTVAVIDTGLDQAHPDRPANIDTANSWDFVDGDANPQDGNGHGTHVTGVIAAATGNNRGVASVAPGVRIMVIRALEDSGSGTGSAVALAIRRAADRGAHVINLSLATDGDSTPVREACAYAASKGCTLVAASGNNGSGVVSYPAAYPGVICVGAVSPARVRAGFSQYGPQMDLVAPGGDDAAGSLLSDLILSLWLNGDYRWVRGTSAAAPHVAGSAALVRSLAPTWSAEMVEQSLATTADDLGASGWDIEYGHGLVRADKALSAVVNATDNDVPGIPARDRRLAGWVDSAHDPHDVYALRMVKGEQLNLSIASAPTGVGVRVLAPSATSVNSPSVATASSSSRSLSYTAAQSGIHYIDVVAGSGSGDYVIDYLSGLVTTLAATAPSACEWGGFATMSGVLRVASGGTVNGRAVTVEAKPHGSTTWKRAGTTTTSPAGAFSIKVYPQERTQYRAVFDGEPRAYQSVTSAAKTVQPYAYLTKPSAPSRIKKGRSFVAAGKLRPWYKAGAKTISVKVSRRVRSGGKYVYKPYKTYKVKNTAYTAKTTKYSKRIRLPYRGKWRIVARVEGNNTFRTTTSSARFVTVY